MIEFEQIDERLTALGKDRAWLSSASGRSIESIGSALAPSASPSKRSSLLQRALSDAIEKEEAKQVAEAATLPNRIQVEPSVEEFRAWDRASRLAGAESMEKWAIEELNAAAEQWIAEAKKPHLRSVETSGNQSPRSTRAGGARKSE